MPKPLNGGTGLRPRKTAGIEAEQFSTTDEAVPMKWFAGEQKMSVTWFSRIHKFKSVQAPARRPEGKK